MLGEDIEVEILNVRAEAKPSRDLMQDLQDIQDGVDVVHASDMEKWQRENKSEKKRLAREKRIARLEKRLIAVGYDNLEEFALDKIHADKWLGKERIAELETIRQENIRKEANMLVQGSILDLISE